MVRNNDHASLQKIPSRIRSPSSRCWWWRRLCCRHSPQPSEWLQSRGYGCDSKRSRECIFRAPFFQNFSSFISTVSVQRVQDPRSCRQLTATMLFCPLVENILPQHHRESNFPSFTICDSKFVKCHCVCYLDRLWVLLRWKCDQDWLSGNWKC